MELIEGRLPMTEAENTTADELLAGKSGSLTRDHDGRLIVQVGDQTWTVDTTGTVT